MEKKHAQTYQIRRTTPEIAKQIHLSLCTWNDDFPTSDTNTCIYWQVLLEGKPVAYTSLSIVDRGASVFLSYSIVSGKHQKRGLHKRMVKVREAYARRKGICVALTYTTKDNSKSWQNLVKMGYRIYDPVFAYVGREYFYFQKKL